MNAVQQPDLSVFASLRERPEIFQQLEETTLTEFQLQKQLREHYPDELVRVALQIYDLRQRAAVKFSRASQMWFTPKGLEQATSEDVAIYKAQRFSGKVWDYCCGIGGDTIALASNCDVTAVDSDATCCLFSEWNCEVYEVRNNITMISADIATLTDRNGLLHVDPDRRTRSQKRSRRVEDGSPDLETLRKLCQEFRGGAIKLSPAANFGGKFDDVEIEIISLRGEAKEAVIWFGELAGEQPFRATALPSGESLAAHPLDAEFQPGPLGRFVYDPDPAIVRAGLVDVLAERENFYRLDDTEEYLTSDELITTPFATPFEVLGESANNTRDIRRLFGSFSFGRVEIKCRHVPIDAESIRRKLPLDGAEPGVLIFARVAGKTRALFCRRVNSAAE